MNNTETGTTEAGRNADTNRPVHLSDAAELKAFLSETDVALVECYTEGCGICRSVEPVLGNLARELDVRVEIINPRDDPPLVERFDVRSVPLSVLFVDGEPVGRLAEGFVSGDELTSWIDERTK